MDVFKEFIVKKEIGLRERLSMAFIMLGSVALGFALIALLLMMGFIGLGCILAAGCCYGGWKLITRFFVEYEYILTNKDLDVDKITNQSARKRLCTVDINSVTEIGRYDPQNVFAESNETTVKAVSGNPELEDYYLRFDHKNLGKCILLFTPSTELFELIEQGLPRKAKKLL